MMEHKAVHERAWILAATLVGMLVVPGALGADAPPITRAQAYPFPQETNLVQFRYHEHRSYEILARPNAPTNIVLEPGETLRALAIGDTVQWITEDVPGHIFIKPLRAGLYTAGTIVTDRRSYQISLRSVTENAHWYQRVSWDYGGGRLVRSRGESWVDTMSEEPEPMEPMGETVDPAISPRPQDLNFGYRVSGTSGIVQNVFDDGRSLWIRLEDGLQELPAVFVQSRTSRQALANYRVDGKYIVVHRISPKTILRIGRDQVVIEK